MCSECEDGVAPLSYSKELYHCVTGPDILTGTGTGYVMEPGPRTGTRFGPEPELGPGHGFVIRKRKT